MMRYLWILLAACALGGWHWWTSERPVARPPGILAAAEPLQRALDAPGSFEARGVTMIARARYTITARVLRRENYRLDGGADIAPVDLAVGWSDVGLARDRRSSSRRWAGSLLDRSVPTRSRFRGDARHQRGADASDSRHAVAGEADEAAPGQLVTIDWLSGRRPRPWIRLEHVADAHRHRQRGVRDRLGRRARRQ
jgi:hypothetical protein